MGASSVLTAQTTVGLDRAGTVRLPFSHDAIKYENEYFI
jgi:hypothetical protein